MVATPIACGAQFSLARKHAKSTLEHGLTNTSLGCPCGTTPNHVAGGRAIWYDRGVTLTCRAADSHPRNTGGSAAPHQSLEEVLL